MQRQFFWHSLRVPTDKFQVHWWAAVLMSAALMCVTTGAYAQSDTDNEQTLEEIQERLDDLEEVLQDVDDRVGSRAVVKAFDGMSLDIGGFLPSSHTHADGETDSATSFNRNIFELLVRAQLSDNWSAFIAQAFIRESDPVFDDDGDGLFNEPGERLNPGFSLVGKTPQVIAWANYKHSDIFNVQFGRFITPHGIINIEHFPAVLLDTEQPQFLRPFGGQTIFPNFVDGVQLHGRKFLSNGKGELSYNTYIASFVGTAEEFILGGRAAYTRGNSGLTFGINASSGQRTSVSGSDYTMLGVDVLYDKGSILWKTEFFTTDEDAGGDRQAFYTQPAWRLNDEWTLFYRFDHLDNGAGLGDRTENVLGVNFAPLPNLRLRSTLTNRAYDAAGAFPDADLLLLQLSATLSF